MRPTDSIKPRELWDQQDRLDFLDGWHEACGIDFRTKRDPDRRVVFNDPQSTDEESPVYHPAAALMAAGRTARQRHQASVGI